MNEEIHSIEKKNNTCELPNLLVGKKPIDIKMSL